MAVNRLRHSKRRKRTRTRNFIVTALNESGDTFNT
jgi:hypothetical protein